MRARGVRGVTPLKYLYNEVMRDLLAVVLAASLATGCVTTRPPPPETAGSHSDYQAGFAEGERAGESAFVGGYSAAGFVGGLLVVVLIAGVVLAAGAGSGGGGCGNCGGGNCGNGSTSSDDDLPAHVAGQNPDFAAGWRDGYKKTFEPRRDRALTIGFVLGVAVFGGFAAYYVSDKERREKVFGPETTALGIGIRF